MRIDLLAPVIERVPPLLHGGPERTVALLAEGLQARGHSVTVFANGDSDASTDPTSATLLHIAEAYEQTLELDVMHNLAGPLAFPFARLSSIPTVTTVFDRLDRLGVDCIYEKFAEQPLVATSWAQRARLPGADWRATIHGAVDIRQFRFRADPGDFLVYVGRVGPADVEDLAEIEDWEKHALLGGAFAFVYPASDQGASELGHMAVGIDAVQKLNRRAARAHVARRFSSAALARMYEQVYADVLADMPRRDAVDLASGLEVNAHHRDVTLGRPILRCAQDDLTVMQRVDAAG